MKLKLATFAILAFSAVGIAQAQSSSSPFTRGEAGVMSRVWSEIRQARDFGDINWRSVGLAGAPGNFEAHRLMADHWSQLRGAAEFYDIDWRAIRYEDRGRSPQRTYGDARGAYDADAGPFTREEARALRNVWPTIREAANFYDINWRSVGLARAPGSRQARRFMADDWGSLRRAAQFDDIDWRAEYRRR
jgi:hypothetical protein